MQKVYYIVKSSYGCFGGSGSVTRMPERYTNKSHAIKACPKNSGRDIYWIDFYWTA